MSLVEDILHVIQEHRVTRGENDDNVSKLEKLIVTTTFMLDNRMHYHVIPESERCDMMKEIIHDEFVADPSPYEYGNCQNFSKIISDLVDISNQEFATDEYCDMLYDFLMRHEYTKDPAILEFVVKNIRKTSYIVNNIVLNHVEHYVWIDRSLITEDITRRIIEGLRDYATDDLSIYSCVYGYVRDRYPSLADICPSTPYRAIG